MIGTTLSHFEITAKLGAGGMGEVYRATDTKLGREVAIKVLPEAVAQDPDRLARFEREAKVLASLNHPNIAAIYSLESAAEVNFLVMELVEGDDLAERIARGPVPLAEALPIALQIAQALETAHESGIIHRDLKPANIKVTAGGQVKVLDFGLAKALETTVGAEAADADPSMSPTLTAQMTQAGVLLGTAAYMSPEQAGGEPADRRADIWAFGVVLAEMLTGRPQFEGKTASHVLAAVLKEEPDWDRFPASTPRAILDLVEHCLRKETTQRLQAIGDARILITDYLENPEAFAPAAAVPRPAPPAVWRQALPWALFVLAVLALVFWKGLGREPDTPRPILKASILPPASGTFYLASWNPGPVAVSPDGNKLAFSVQEEDGSIRLWVRSLESDVARPLSGTESAAYHFWSPDSRWIGFFTDVDQTLKKIDTAGGPPVTICPAENGKGGTWNRDGVILFSPRADTPIHRVPDTGGEPTPITQIEEPPYNSHRHPRFLPDGRHFIYLARGAADHESAAMLGALDGSVDRKLVQSSTQVEYAAGYLLFTRGTTLMAQPFDPQRLELSAQASPLVVEILTVPGAALGAFSASEAGVLAYNSGKIDPAVSLERRDRNGKILSTIGEPATFGTIALSPDGEQLVAVQYDHSGVGSLWLTEIATGLRTRFTFDPASDYGLAWSPAGDSVVFSARSANRFEIHRKSTGGLGEMERLLGSDEEIILSSVSSDGRTVLFWRTSPGTSRDLWVWDLEDGGEPAPFRQTEADERGGAFSPDGRWIAYASNESGRYEVYVAPFPGPGRRWQVSQEGGLFPQWRASGREIVYTQQDGQLMAVEVTTGADSLQAGAPRPLFRIHPPPPDGASFALTPADDQLILWTTLQRNSETVVNLVVNWPAELATP